MIEILLVLLSASPVFVPVGTGRVASLSITHCGAIDVVVAGAGESWSDVRLRPDAPYARNAPVGNVVMVTMLVASRITTGMTMRGTTTAAVVVSPAGIMREVASQRRAVGASIVNVGGCIAGPCAGTKWKGRGHVTDECNCKAELASLRR